MTSEKPLSFPYQFAAGAVAGISEFSQEFQIFDFKLISCRYPLDVVKTRIQLQSNKSVQINPYGGMLDCFQKIVQNEGFARLYRGIEAPVFMEAPKRAIKFAANDFWGKFYRDLFGAIEMDQRLSVLAGASAGASEAFVVVPFDLVKIRLQDRVSAMKYSGPTDCLIKTVRTEGFLALFNGLESTLWRHIFWNSGYFGCIFQVREILPKSDTRKTRIINDLVSGAIGGTVGTILNTPMDVVKSRIQNNPKIPGVVPKYSWAWPAIMTIFREEGFRALYKGFLPKVIRLGPGGGILLVVFTAVSDFFKNMAVVA
ncbi:putative mitochondrial 2-oxodicarboxylate carrier 2 [Erysiphe necator]|uniref:Putative mitochondrial 2-oxodicarboxylate carrier 2 n=1 Tax=Uncinula necator TaxID=52586 RepID=A0A0B1PG28_UNCNE|nr:putative mitochondrial 2-oxodicarboxylate carrier 2 [Erysiphe necator]